MTELELLTFAQERAEIAEAEVKRLRMALASREGLEERVEQLEEEFKDVLVMAREQEQRANMWREKAEGLARKYAASKSE